MGRRLTVDRARNLFAVWTFSLSLVWIFSLFLLGAPEPPASWLARALNPIVSLGSMALLTFLLLWEAFRGVPRIAKQEGHGFQAPPAIVVLYLGTFTLLVSLVHFGFVSGVVDPDAEKAFAFSGLLALLLPMTLYTLFYAQRRVSPPARSTLLRSFGVGALGATVVYFQRTALGDFRNLSLWSNLGVVAVGEVTILACVTTIVASSAVARRIDAAAAGVACAFGFAVAYIERLIAPSFGQLVEVASALTRFSPGLNFYNRWFDPSKLAPIPQTDALTFFLAGPASAALTASFIWTEKPQARAGRRILVSCGILLFTLLYTTPLYQYTLFRLPLDPVSASLLTPGLYFGSIAYLAIFVLIAALYVYRTAWQPAQKP